MRKLLALLLSVLMLASLLAAIPASAATATYDGTTKDTAGLNELIISEVGRKMSYYRNGNTTLEGLYPGSMNFIEIYNNGAGDVELDSLSLLLGVEFDTAPDDAASPYHNYRTSEDEPLWKEWRDHYRFISEMEIKDGELIDSTVAAAVDMAAGIHANLTNAGEDMTLSNGENAIVWLITAKTIEWMVWGDDEVAGFDPRTEFLKSYYGANVNPDDYKVIMVWAYSDYIIGETTILAEDMFNFDNVPSYSNLEMSYIVGLAKDTWEIATDVAYDKVNTTFNEDIYCMSVLGTKVPGYASQADYTATYVPATAVPHIQNAYNKFLDSDAVAYTDYLDAGLIRSYRETGVVNWASDPTPGTMPAWQWAIIDPANANAPASLKTEGAKDDAKVAAAIQAYVDALGYVDDGADAGRNESNINHEYNFESQESIKNRFNNKKKQEANANGGGLATWALILIIVGGVLVVAGGACAVVFLVILPKKKAAAAVNADEISAEDAPVEDAPAAEENKEE